MNKNKNSLTLIELAKKYLDPDVEKSIPDVDIDIKKIGFEFSVKEFKIIFHANQISVAILVIVLITLATLLRG